MSLLKFVLKRFLQKYKEIGCKVFEDHNDMWTMFTTLPQRDDIHVIKCVHMYVHVCNSYKII